MPKCVICGEKFYYSTYLDPDDPCACGNQVTVDVLDEIDPAEIDDMRDEWRERLREDEPEDWGWESD